MDRCSLSFSISFEFYINSYFYINFISNLETELWNQAWNETSFSVHFILNTDLSEMENNNKTRACDDADTDGTEPRSSVAITAHFPPSESTFSGTEREKKSFSLKLLDPLTFALEVAGWLQSSVEIKSSIRRISSCSLLMALKGSTQSGLSRRRSKNLCRSSKQKKGAYSRWGGGGTEEAPLPWENSNQEPPQSIQACWAVEMVTRGLTGPFLDVRCTWRVLQL